MSRSMLFILAVVFSASSAFAHPGHDVATSAWSGLIHPLTGLDHVAAMIAIGIWAALAGGRQVWLWPATFVAAMLAGGFAGYNAGPLPWGEQLIALSVVALGVLVAFGVRTPLLFGAALIAVFGVLHGYAHGVEADEARLTAYAGGFVASTALLHLTGIALGTALSKAPHLWSPRATGLATAVLGAVLIVR